MCSVCFVVSVCVVVFCLFCCFLSVLLFLSALLFSVSSVVFCLLCCFLLCDVDIVNLLSEKCELPIIHDKISTVVVTKGKDKVIM